MDPSHTLSYLIPDTGDDLTSKIGGCW
uniref:Uncharacterized protein n=1 Tax=Rhizophora mucronata TaxID=61149 RepID=A0A2P2N862_RHIMU